MNYLRKTFKFHSHKHTIINFRNRYKAWHIVGAPKALKKIIPGLTETGPPTRGQLGAGLRPPAHL